MWLLPNLGERTGNFFHEYKAGKIELGYIERATLFTRPFICFCVPITCVDIIILAVQFLRDSGVKLFKRNLTKYSTRIKYIGLENNKAFSYQVALVELISTPKENNMDIESRIAWLRSMKRPSKNLLKNRIRISPSFLCWHTREHHATWKYLQGNQLPKLTSACWLEDVQSNGWLPSRASTQWQLIFFVLSSYRTLSANVN